MFHVKQSHDRNTVVIKLVAREIEIVVPTDSIAAHIHLDALK